MRKLILMACGLLVACVAWAEGVDRDYVLGSGDMVRISVYGNPDLATETRLTAGGTISYPLLGEVKVGGEAVPVAEKKIAKLLEDGGFVVNPQVNLVVLSFQSQQISVLGDVLKPGRYSLERPSTLTDVLALAGGPNGNGSDLVTVLSKRGSGVERKVYDLRELIAKADTAENPRIMGDDIVHVGAREVSVLGYVQRPGKYSASGGVRNLVDFLAMAGGVVPAAGDTLVVITNVDGKPVRQELDVEKLFSKEGMTANFDLRAGDQIYVPRAPVYYIYGEVQRPGSYRLERNMTLMQALSVGGGLNARGTERGIRVHRRNQGGEVEEIKPAMTDALKPDDVIYVRESLF
jgi:polysaccharide export outer membrane protein